MQNINFSTEKFQNINYAEEPKWPLKTERTDFSF